MPLGMSAADLAGHLGVAPDEVEKIIGEQAPITDDMAAKLGTYFQTSAEVWIGVQRHFDAKTAGGHARD